MTESTHDTSPTGAFGDKNFQQRPSSKRRWSGRQHKRAVKLFSHDDTDNGVLHIHCPICRTSVLMTCPYCLKGALVCDEDQYILSCNHCHALVKYVFCPQEHQISISYIREKQKALLELADRANGKGIVAVFATFLGYALIIGFIIQVLTYWGGY